jgi:chromate transporter
VVMQEGRAIFVALQAAVLALIVRAVHRIGSRALRDRWLLVTALASLAGSLAGVHFAINLGLSGAFYFLLRKQRRGAAVLAGAAWLAVIVLASLALGPVAPVGASPTAPPGTAPLPLLLYSGLKSGLLTFGGAYTAIPFLQEDAVVDGAWMSNDQFLDGLALSGILPAPLIIFGTFVGFLGGGWLGALALTAGIFLPAFGFTLIAHDALERITQSERLRHFLAGTTAGVVGLIAATTVQLAPAALGTLGTGAVFVGALLLLYFVRHELQVLLVMGCAAATGWLFF